MAATVQVSETNGTIIGAVTTDGISNINFSGVDGPNIVPASHPIVLSAFAQTYSFVKWVRLLCTNMGGSALLTNFKVWKSSGAYKTAEMIGYTSWMASTLTYGISPWDHVNPVVPMPYQGNGQGTFHNPFFDWSVIQIQNAEPVSPNLNLNGGISMAPQYSGYGNLCLQVDGSLGTPAGPVNQKVFTFQYDES